PPAEPRLQPGVAPAPVPAPFFFSRRRRHTRFSRDWSSDVCSSDLWPGGTGDALRAALPPAPADVATWNRLHAAVGEAFAAAAAPIGRASCRETGDRTAGGGACPTTRDRPPRRRGWTTASHTRDPAK